MPEGQAPETVTNGVTADDSFQARYAAVEAEARAESDAASVAEPDAPAPAREGTAPPDAPTRPDVTKTPPPATDPDKERAERLARAAGIERENVRAKIALAQKDRELREAVTQLSEREKTIAQREARAKQLEKALDDPSSLMDLLQERVGAEKLAQWLMDQSQPHKVAEAKARAAASPVSEELKKLRDELAAEKAERTARESQQQHHAMRADAERSVVDRIKEAAVDVPHSARWAEKRPGELLARAHLAADELRAEGLPFNRDDVILRVERDLVALYADAPGSPQQPGQQQAPSGTERTSTAAAKAPTVSNRAAAERSSLLGDDEVDLPFDERIRRLEKRVRSAS